MIDPTFDSLPLTLKWALGLGWFLGGLGAWFLGRKFRAATPDEAGLRETAGASREIERLQHQINIDELRRDLGLVVQAARVALEGQFQGLENEMRQEVKDVRDDMRTVLGEYDRRIRDVELDNARGRPRPR